MNLSTSINNAVKEWEIRRGLVAPIRRSFDFGKSVKKNAVIEPDKPKISRSEAWREWFASCTPEERKAWSDGRRSKLSPEERKEAKKARNRRARQAHLKKRKDKGLPARSEAERIRIRQLYKERAANLTPE